MPAKPSLGLYFTDNFIEISQISSDGLRLEKFNQLGLPFGLVQNGEIKDKKGFANILRQLLSTSKPSPINFRAEVVVGVNDNRVFLREFSVPNMPGQNSNDAIEYQVRNLLPVLPSGVETDWEIIGRSSEGHIEVLLAAITRNIIESYVSICTEVGLRVVAVEPAVFANIRIIDQTQIQGKNQLLVFLGENFGVFSYITSGNPRFSDFLPQAEIEKNGGVNKSILAYINFANSKHPHRPVTEILISGSRQDLDILTEGLKVDNVAIVKAASRLANTEMTGGNTLLHTAHGLSLKTYDDKPLINLLPVDFRLELIKEKLTLTWKIVLGAMIFVTILIISGMALLYRDTLDREVRLKTVKAQYEEQFQDKRNQDLINQANKLNKISGELVLLRGITGGEENLLKQLSAITPEGITLSSFIISRSAGSKQLADPLSTWIITGKAISRNQVLAFYSSLLSAPEFSEGKLYFGSLEKDSGLTFRIANQPKVK